VIPTRNRCVYAVHSIRNALGSASPALEVVVHDNSSDDGLERYVREQFHDPRLRYYHECERLSVAENFERATTLARGEYVASVGDDDGVNPEIIDAALWAQEEGMDAIVPTIPAQYWWPDFRHRHYGRSFSGSLVVRPFSGLVTLPAAEDQLRRCVRQAGQGGFGVLPGVYYGIVRRACLERVKARAGMFFPGPSPDIAGAAAVASFVKRMARVDYPLFLPGNSSAGGAGMKARKAHLGRLEAQAHLSKDVVGVWSELVPRFFSMPTIWAEDVIQALRATGRDDLLAEFNFPLLYARCSIFHPSHLRPIMRSFHKYLSSSKRGRTLSIAQFAWACAFTVGLRARYLARNVIAGPLHLGTQTVSGLDDIEEAWSSLSENLLRGGWRLRDRLESAAREMRGS